MSKGLETLECGGINVYTKDYGKCIAYTQDCIDIIEKELKALDIIKNKEVNIFAISQAIKMNDLSLYNEWVSWNVYGKHLTQEEFDLLKEVLCDE